MKDYLDLQMDKLSNSVVESERKYFHFRTVGNLIFHFDNLKDETDKKWVFETLDKYFQKCFEVGMSVDRKVSQNLFLDYINKITDYYHTNLGFSVIMNRTVLYVAYFLILFLCYYFFAFYVVIGVAALFVYQIIISFRKYRERKVYGLFF